MTCEPVVIILIMEDPDSSVSSAVSQVFRVFQVFLHKETRHSASRGEQTLDQDRGPVAPKHCASVTSGPLQQHDFFLFQSFFVDLLPFFETLSCCTAILVGQIASHLTTACFDICVQSFSNCIVTSLTLNILTEVCRVFDVALGFFAMSVSISQSDLGVKLLRISTPGQTVVVF